MSSSLSSVVSNLVRASMGSGVSNTVTDEDLDRHVAELILKEAKQKALRYGQDGIRAYLPSGGMSDSNAPKTNKRFLSSIIRSTDDHNKTILRAQALAAQEVKREREELERRERRARAEEAVEAERMRRLGGSGRRRKEKEEESWDRWNGRTEPREGKRKQRSWETWDGNDEEEEDNRESGHRRRRHRSRRNEEDDSHTRHERTRIRSRSPRRDDEGHSSHRVSRDNAKEPTTQSPLRAASPDAPDEYDRKTHKRHRTRSHRHSHKTRRSLSAQSPSARSTHSPQPSRSPTLSEDRSGTLHSKDSRRHRRRSPSPSHSITDIDREAELRRKLKGKRRVDADDDHPNHRSRDNDSISGIKHKRDASPPGGSSSRTASFRAHSRSRSPTPGPEPDTFSRLPSKMDKYFEESYDPRLDVAPLSAPKVPATGLIDNSEFEGWDAMLELIRIRREDKEEKKRMERLGISKDKVKDKKRKGVVESVGASERWSGEGVSIMEIEYKKKGSVREWDLGKEGF